ncbi:hypothetical protein ABFS82_06G035100 [Erythranthe guttata]|uniref:Single-strand DNA endonuclease 1 n=1 Tax=Erythranthe guttata TaxID=4155 RepID=A0A022QAV9_ERYGU|nr:PREDICTED: flap endonuclease GEN-like 2 isoform X1 [Erythranthe guttata]EYU25081.1 hypothetical protein MIMGU_mgv1a022889mg [Erythranthe guttata]|eukprot:XP_012852173.1 PREDICTED: flap endonuclease GEN-like 2 isoform X1 [Erythranthe guttata]
MGVKNLWDILESCKKTIPLHHLQNKRVCVDLSCWMVQLQKVNKTHCPIKDKLYLQTLFHRLRSLIALNCSLIFVTDGSIPAIKLSTYRRRLNAGNEVVLDAGDTHNVSSVKRNMGSAFSCMIKEAKFLGMALGIPCLDGIEEAEAQCALLNSESLCDACFTSDSDAFLFGARTVYRDICLGEGGYVVCYEMDDIERELGFGRNSLITLAVLLGSDYSQRIRGFGPESASQIVKSIGDSSVLQRFASEGLSIVKKIKCSKKKGLQENNTDHGIKCDLPIDNQFLKVINAYLKPKCHSADSDVVHRVLALYPFNRSQLHQICAQFFEWPPEKTDEYILPKIAERNLRRYSNLRATSSEFGVHLPIDEMPVECPVSSIVKQRKSLGRDYFEVSWQGMDGLQSSAIPADLVESACPEKILEFQQRKAQKQKPARKTKSKKIAEMKEIDEKLQQLLLEIEQESTATRGSVVPQEIRNAGTDYLTTHVNNLEDEDSSNNGGNSISGCYSFSASGTEIIDLISPLPRRHVHVASKSQETRCMDVIELSDTDNEVSPEHARRGKDLRLFLASIRDELS